MKTKFTVFVLMALAMASCNSEKKTNPGNKKNNTEIVKEAKDAPIENTKWVIAALEDKNLADSWQEIYFVLNPETNMVSGNTGCNTFKGTYNIQDGNRITFSKMASTRKACPDLKIKEPEILNIFETADNFTISGNTLSLNKAKRAPLAVFKKAENANAPIVEKYWKLKTLEGKTVTMDDKQEREIYFMLKTNQNRVTGFAGCNTFSGEYNLEKGNRIRFKNMATTLKTCPDINVDETEFLKIFELADNYTITNDELSLNVGRRAPLAVFEAVYFD